jgi:adenylosuccinate lyase
MTLTPACAHTRGHITDSRFYGDRYATAASRRIFCDVCRHQRWLDIEAALALAEADLGMIPADAAERICRAARVDLLDLDAVEAAITESGHSLVGLLRVFETACEGDSGQYIHYGATTQDIQDTGQALETRDVLDELDGVLRALLARLAELAEANADTVAVGRTHAQPALPLSFGMKVASWADETLRHLSRIDEARPRLLVAELYGGVGSMAAFGGRGPELVELFAARLGLAAPAMGWHVARDRVAEFVGSLAMVAGTMARIADEIRTLSRPEFGEVEEGWRYGKVGSSTMPHKRNPERSEQAVMLAKLAAAQVPLALAGMVGDHERDSRALRLEWACVPDVSHYCLAACEIVLELANGLIVHRDRMLANAQSTADQTSTEAVMLALGRRIGKQRAHEQVYELSQHSRSCGRTLRELLTELPDPAAQLLPGELDRLFDPARNLGDSPLLARRVAATVRERLAADADAAASGDGAGTLVAFRPPAQGHRDPAGPSKPDSDLLAADGVTA